MNNIELLIETKKTRLNKPMNLKKFLPTPIFFSCKKCHKKQNKREQKRAERRSSSYIINDDLNKSKIRLKRQAITVTQSVDGTTSTTFNITPLVYRILLEVAGPIFSQVVGR